MLATAPSAPIPWGIDEPAPTILGRTGELRRLRAVIAGARNGRAGALLMRGEPGIGKTALLDEVARELQGVRLLRTDGFGAESAMPYAAIQRLGTPLAAHLPALPPRQAAALRIAAGLDDGDPPDRYLVGLGALSLLAAAGEVEPVVCIVDDAHLLDPESLEVLAFVARRLEAESVAVLLAARPDDRADAVSAGVPRLDLVGLDALSSVQLLTRSVDAPIDPFLATRIAEETGGNPLALIDLARESTARELTESSIAQTPVPVGARLERHYLAQVEALPPQTRTWLLVAAAETTGDRELIDAAAARLGANADAAAAAEVARLVAVRGSVAFRHPLVRAAVYNGTPDADRRNAHEALAEAADARGRGDLAVWHAAAATVGVDDDVANRLERLADSAAVRGGTGSRARLLARAAELTPEGPARDARLLIAAEAAAGAGAAGLALDLLDRIDAERFDPVSLGRALGLRAMLALFVGDPVGIARGTETMLRVADLSHGLAPELEQRALLRAFEAELTAEWAVTGATLPELGRRITAGAHVADGPMSVALDALGAHILEPYADAVPRMQAAIAMLRAADDALLLDIGFFGVAITMALWDERACVEILERTAIAARDAGALRVLDTTLWLLGLLELVRGDPEASGRYIEQVRELRRAIGYDAEHVVNASHLAWSGAPVELVEQIADGVLATGFVGAWTVAMMGLSVRANAEGRYADAYDTLEPLVARRFLQVTYQELPEFVEAAARSGHPEVARAETDRLAEMAAASGTPWIRGLAARSAALLANDDEAAERLHLEAIEQLALSTARGDLGRAHLVYGEWLRRVRRRREAREQLRMALAIFTAGGAAAFAERARRELEATGEHVDRATTTGTSTGAATLTPQESTIARLAAAGATNAEIGSTLFISVNTVDYHLRKVFRKLGVTSRRQLAEHLASG